MFEHDRVKELCALAALGQVSADELRILREHLIGCESCRAASAEFAQVLNQDLPLAHNDSAPWLNSLRDMLKRDRYRERFLEHTKAHGIRFSEEIERDWKTSARVIGRFTRLDYALALVIVLAMFSIGIAVMRMKGRSVPLLAQSSKPENRLSALMLNADLLRGELAAQSARIHYLEAQLVLAQNAARLASARAAEAEREGETYAAQAQALKKALAASQASFSDLSLQIKSADSRIADLNTEIERLNRLHADDEVSASAYQRQIDEMGQQLKAQNEIVKDEAQLLAAGRDVRELMGARHLHIIDVFDTELSGANRRAFGRVFYTEGQSLIFYAFDLAKREIPDAKHSFQAWGVSEAKGRPARSLGIFYVDDAAEKRWVLKVEDSRLLEQIDSVFVTVEPFGGAKQPSGQKLLYAYLKNPANHP